MCEKRILNIKAFYAHACVFRTVTSFFLEVSEFFEIVNSQAQTLEYRHHWMDSTRQHLIRRWDNAPHYPALSGFPHHVHVESESRVEPGSVLSITALIEWFEREFGNLGSETE